MLVITVYFYRRCVCVCERDIGREIINIPKRFFSYSDRCDAIVKKKKKCLFLFPLLFLKQKYTGYIIMNTHTHDGIIINVVQYKVLQLTLWLPFYIYLCMYISIYYFQFEQIFLIIIRVFVVFLPSTTP